MGIKYGHEDCDGYDHDCNTNCNNREKKKKEKQKMQKDTEGGGREGKENNNIYFESYVEFPDSKQTYVTNLQIHDSQ